MPANSSKTPFHIWVDKNKVPILIGVPLIMALVIGFLVNYFIRDIENYFEASPSFSFWPIGALSILFFYALAIPLQRKFIGEGKKSPEKAWPKVFPVLLSFLLFLLAMAFGTFLGEVIVENKIPGFWGILLLFTPLLVFGLFKGVKTLSKK